MTSLAEFEGIWEGDDGDYTIGLFYDENDRRYPHKGFIIESIHPNWKPGEIKVKFSKLDGSGIGISKWTMQNKSERTITFEATPSSLININPSEPSIIFIKTYPRDNNVISRNKGSGSGWHIGGGYVVTNAHVINGANKIEVRYEGNFINARAVTVDSKLDIAIVQLDTLPGHSIASGKQEVKCGSNNIPVGYPLGDL